MTHPERGRNNRARLDWLLRDHGTEVLRSMVERNIPPGKLQDYLSSPEFQGTLERAHCDGYISMHQRRKLWTCPRLETFDISLLAALLKIAPVFNLKPASSREWKDQIRWDQSKEVNIATLRDYRNELAHSTSASIDDVTFEEYWGRISSAIIALGGTEKERYASAISQLKSPQESVDVNLRLQHLEGMLIVIPMSYGSSEAF